MLLDYYKKYYQQNTEQAKKDGCIFYEGAYRLSLKQKQEILTNNIYGVDIDQQAVEVTQLSLYLKLLEDESTATANDTWVLFKEQLLPDLNKNIVCGNSLIGTDILNLTLQFPLLDKERGRSEVDELKIKPMDFENVFPEVMNKGGFDAIVGNPPYGAELSEFEKTYLNKCYKIQTTDTAALFIDKANKLLIKIGRLSYIIPKPFLFADGWNAIRKKYLPSLETVIDCGKVWRNVKLEQIIIVETKGTEFKEYNSGYRRDEELIIDQKITKELSKNFEMILSNINLNEINLGMKIKLQGKSLGAVCDIKRGLDIQDALTEKNIFKNIYRSKSIGRFELKDPKEGITKSTYLELKSDLQYMEQKKIIIQNIVAHVMNPTDHIILMASMDEEGLLGLGSVGNIFIKDEKLNPYFIVALLNSKLFSWYAYRFIYGKAIRTMRFDQHHLNKLTLPPIKIETLVEHPSYKSIVAYSNQITAAKKQLQQAKTESDKTYLERKCTTLDKQIDDLVYQLYRLTEDEIKIVEGV